MDERLQSVHFDEEEHKYFYKHKELSGITTPIGNKLKIQFPQEMAHVQVALSYGSQVHKEVEEWIKYQVPPTTKKALWILEELNSRHPLCANTYKAELLVSDFIDYASSIDVVVVNHETGDVSIYDTKTGEFKREYCTIQLSMYAYLYELDYGVKVKDAYVFCSKDELTYHILIKPWDRIKRTFYKE